MECGPSSVPFNRLTNADLLPPLSTHVSLAGAWKVPCVLAVLGLCALFIDAPLSSAMVHEGILNKWDGLLEDVELLGHASIVILVLIGVGLSSPARRWAVPRVVLTAFCGGLAADILKMTMARVRPFEHSMGASVWESFRAPFPGITAGSIGQSFPSGHAATATALAAALGAMFPKARWFFFTIAVMVAMQRVETGAHFLSDTLWGAAAGYCVYLYLFGPTKVGLWFDKLEVRLASATATTPEAADVADDSKSEMPHTIVSAQLADMALFTAEGPGMHPADEPDMDILPLRPVTSLSVVVPMYNERENVERCYDALLPVLTATRLPFEILFVDDGSTDGTSSVLRDLAERDEQVKVVHFRRNFGQTAAMSAGLESATGDAIVLMDGDLQNDPTDIPMMLEKLNRGYDLVHGWRKERQDRFLDRRLPSMMANWLISKTTGFPVHDLGCTLKLLRREVAQDLRLYGELHRFIPILAHFRGARCVEVVTKHHPRRFGTSKYGLSRTLRVLLDLITVKFLTQSFISPMKLFGHAGLACIAMGFLAGFATIVMKLASGVDMTGNPLLLGSVFSIMLGTQFFCLGALGEVGVRTYFESQGRTTYAIRERRNFEDTQPRKVA